MLMGDLDSEIEELERELEQKERQVEELRKKINFLKSKESSAAKSSKLSQENKGVTADRRKVPPVSPTTTSPYGNLLDRECTLRYSRQLILPEIGVEGQLALCSSSVLVVGAGGLGCPCLLYLAAAGVGKIGIVDYDQVEISNLHRQILHSQDRVGTPKAASAVEALKRLNSRVSYVAYDLQLTSANALEIVSNYDVVVDGTDNVATRYLLNDACVLAGKPLVSGSALRLEGQLTVYNHRGSPCYRCLYPTPPPPHTVTNCSDGGVLGVVPGIIGCLQALEALKIAMGQASTYLDRLLLFDAGWGQGEGASFRTVRLRGSQPDCALCGRQPTLSALIDYQQFCGTTATDKCQHLQLLERDQRISAREYAEIRVLGTEHCLLDVRPTHEVKICQLQNSLNIPLKELELPEKLDFLKKSIFVTENKSLPVYVICKQGNDSQRAVQLLRGWQKLLGPPSLTSACWPDIKDVEGGLLAWATSVDPQFPRY